MKTLILILLGAFALSSVSAQAHGFYGPRVGIRLGFGYPYGWYDPFYPYAYPYYYPPYYYPPYYPASVVLQQPPAVYLEPGPQAAPSAPSPSSYWYYCPESKAYYPYVADCKEELPGGLKTGIIRAMAGSGAVVTAAGLVFAATMASFVFADLRILGQIGTTIALGLLFDTLIVRSFMTPSIAALLGRWFWWPRRVHTHAAPQPAATSPPPGPASR